MFVINYFTQLSKGKTILWCYLIWYLVIAYFYFDPTPRIWLNSAGIGLIIGFALLLSVSEGLPRCNWQTVRLFMMPFCVSSFSSLIKERNFLLIFPPNKFEMLVAIGFCLLIIASL